MAKECVTTFSPFHASPLAKQETLLRAVRVNTLCSNATLTLVIRSTASKDAWVRGEVLTLECIHETHEGACLIIFTAHFDALCRLFST